MEPRPRDAERPIAVFKGRDWLGLAADPCCLFWGAITGTVVATAFARHLPWPSALAGAPGLEGLVLLFGLAGFAALVVIQRWALARLGQAELFADRLVIKHQRRFLTIRLSEIEAFDDGSADYVKLSIPGSGWAQHRRDVTVPTPGETDRAALVGALASANIPRLEGQSIKPPARAPEASALLEVRSAPLAVALSVTASLAVLGLLVLLKVPPLVWAALCVPLVAIPILAGVWSNPRTGNVEFHEDRIVIDPFAESSPDAWRLTLAWDDVVGWRPTSHDYLRLVLRPGLLRGEHGEPTVPTPTPELRAKVEALLTERGVPRL